MTGGSVEDATEYFISPDAWPSELVDGLSRLQGRVLDVGCGAGRHALYLASRGCEVVGLDPSPGAIEVCDRRGVDAILGRLGDASRAYRFDGIALLGNNFGLFASPEQAPAHLRWLADRCVPGATLVGDAQDPTHTDNPDHLAYHQRQRAKGRPPGEVRLRVMFRAGRRLVLLLASRPRRAARRVSETPWHLVSITGSPI